MQKTNILTIINAYLTPKLFLTRVVGWLAKREWGKVTELMIKAFIKIYKIDIEASQLTNISEYKTFNQFFIREIKPELRPIDTNDASVVFPADGRISSFGQITTNIMLQAKGYYFSLDTLLAEQEELIKLFINGKYQITYLSPKDYHRVHMPCNATLKTMVYVPGDLFSVNPSTVEQIPNIFARNERVICYFNTDFGPMVQILVGATITASISTVWHGVVNPLRDGNIKVYNYEDDSPIKLHKGDEMGAFQMGSTVINLFPENTIDFGDNLYVGNSVAFGSSMAKIK